MKLRELNILNGIMAAVPRLISTNRKLTINTTLANTVSLAAGPHPPGPEASVRPQVAARDCQLQRLRQASPTLGRLARGILHQRSAALIDGAYRQGEIDEKNCPPTHRVDKPAAKNRTYSGHRCSGCRPDANGTASGFAREISPKDRQAVRHQESGAAALSGAAKNKPIQVGCECASHRCQAEQCRPNNQEAHASQPDHQLRRPGAARRQGAADMH